MARNNRARGNEFWRFNRWGSPILGVLVIVMALGGIAVSNAEPTQADGAYCAPGECEGSERWGRSSGGHRFFGRRGHDPERAREHLQYAAGWMLNRLDVDDAVEEKIEARLDAAFVELMPLFEEHRDSKHTFFDGVLGPDEVDRAALESRRKQAIASADEASQIVTRALADVAEMLTPEQRAQIAERMRRHHR